MGMKKRIIDFFARMGVDLTSWRLWRYERIETKRAPKTYSQFGEDACLRGLMEQRLQQNPAYRGFWVDIGAHHPTRYSNTRMFSEMGWRGINVDAMPEVIDLFRKRRPQDINVNVGIGDKPGELAYYQFPDHAYNTFLKTNVDGLARKWGRELVEGRDYNVRMVEVITLRELLDGYLPKGQKIDFLTVDAEGMDQAILESNDWSLYRPDFILVEVIWVGDGQTALDNDITRFLSEVGYELVGLCSYTAVFRLK